MSRTPSGQEERRRENILPIQKKKKQQERVRKSGRGMVQVQCWKKVLIENERERLRKILKLRDIDVSS